MFAQIFEVYGNVSKERRHGKIGDKGDRMSKVTSTVKTDMALAFDVTNIKQGMGYAF